MMRLALGMLGMGIWLLLVGLAGESDRRSADEARYRAALAHLEMARADRE